MVYLEWLWRMHFFASALDSPVNDFGMFPSNHASFWPAMGVTSAWQDVGALSRYIEGRDTPLAEAFTKYESERRIPATLTQLLSRIAMIIIENFLSRWGFSLNDQLLWFSGQLLWFFGQLLWFSEIPERNITYTWSSLSWVGTISVQSASQSRRETGRD